MTPSVESSRPECIVAVSFDVNGTLIHSPRLGAIYADVLARHGYETRPEQIEATIRQVWLEMDCASPPGGDRFSGDPGGTRGFWSRFVDRVCAYLQVAPASRFAKAELFDRFARAESWEVFEEVPSVLKTLREAGYRLAVLSNWDERLPALLAELELGHYFEVVVFSSEVGVEKPFTGIFESLLSTLALPPQAVLHVGDRRREDEEGAIGAGMQALRVTRDGPETEPRGLRSVLDLLIEKRSAGTTNRVTRSEP